MARAARRAVARMLYAASEADPDILYPTGFFAPDPFLFVETRGKRVLVMSDLEMDRARRQATVDQVLSWTVFARKVEARGGRGGAAGVIAAALRHLKVRTVAVPRSFPLGLSMELDELGVRLEVEPDPFWPEREIKTAAEVRAIRAALRAAEAGLLAGIAALQDCRIGRDPEFLLDVLDGIAHPLVDVNKSVSDLGADIDGDGRRHVLGVGQGGQKQHRDQSREPHVVEPTPTARLPARGPSRRPRTPIVSRRQAGRKQ
jgi:hypothetical protein